MQSTSRTFKQCMFCNATTISREHVWGRSLHKRFPEQERVRVPKSAYSGDMICGGYHALSMTTRSMCEACNNGFSNEMKIVTEPIARLMKGVSNRILGVKPKIVVRYFQRVGAILDLETAIFDPILMRESDADIARSQPYLRCPPVLDANERKILVSGGVLGRVHVHLGKHSGEIGRNFGMTFANILDPSGALVKRFIFAFGSLTGLVCIGNVFHNRNAKLASINDCNGEIRLDPMRISFDGDVQLNCNSFTTHPDGSVSCQ